MNQAIRKLSGLLVLPVLLAALLMMPVRAHAEETADAPVYNNDYACDVELPISMKLNGNHGEAFEVVLEADVEKNKGAEVPMPSGDTKLSLKKDETGSFTMHYTEPGDYFYILRQTAGDTPYMTYDDTVYYVQIQITNTDDYLDLKSQVAVTTADDPEEKQPAIVFLNTYAPPAPGPAATATPTPTPAPAAPTATPTAGITLPQTGDTMPLVTVFVVMLVAAAALVVLFVVRKRKENDK